MSEIIFFQFLARDPLTGASSSSADLFLVSCMAALQAPPSGTDLRRCARPNARFGKKGAPRDSRGGIPRNHGLQTVILPGSPGTRSIYPHKWHYGREDRLGATRHAQAVLALGSP